MAGQNSIHPILNALYVFEAAARELNFTSAARALGMAQPSVSRFVANLEDHLGLALFHRDHNRITLTDAGSALFAATEHGLGHIQSVIDEFALQGAEKRLVISCTHGFAHMWIVPRIRHLKALLPGWEILLSTSEQPYAGDFDAADIVIRFGAGDWPEIRKIPLFQEQVFPVCAPDLLYVRDLTPEDVTPDDLLDLPLIVQDHGEHGWLSWSDWFDAFDLSQPDLPDPHPVPSYHFVLQAATQGEGVALVWQHLAEPYLSNGWLLELPDMRVKTQNSYYATYPENHAQADKIEQWVAQIEAR